MSSVFMVQIAKLENPTARIWLIKLVLDINAKRTTIQQVNVSKKSACWIAGDQFFCLFLLSQLFTRSWHWCPWWKAHLYSRRQSVYLHFWWRSSFRRLLGCHLMATFPVHIRCQESHLFFFFFSCLFIPFCNFLIISFSCNLTIPPHHTYASNLTKFSH